MGKTSQVDVSVIIPTLNEREAIVNVIERIRKHLPNCEIIVVDSSDDDTYELALRSGVRVLKEPRLGYGHAIRRGLSVASGKILLFIDGDNSYSAYDIPSVIEPIKLGEADLSIGTRFHSRPQGMTLTRYIGNLIINMIFSNLFKRRITDSQTGLKAMSAEAYRKLELRENGMSFSTEVILKSILKNLRIKEVQVSYNTRVGHSKLNPIKDGVKIILYMLSQKFY
ncbi:MAG: glycosyltransferase family 2 protein [Thermoproteota archaeon]